MTVTHASRRILVSGLSQRKGECGTFEIDAEAGTIRTLLVGAYPNCGGGGGAVSPDGKRALTYAGKVLSLIDLETGVVQAITGVGGIGLREITWSGDVTWSPDGRWISAILDRKILLIDAKDTSRRKRLSSSAGGPVVWSPDSKYLLLRKSQLRCASSLYFESLEVIELATEKRTVIESSRCEVGTGWVDPEVFR